MAPQAGTPDSRKCGNRTARRRRARRPSSSAAGPRRRPTPPGNGKPRRRRTSLETIKQRMRIDAADGRNADTASPQQHLFRVVDPVEQTAFSGIDRAHEGPRRHLLTPEKKADRLIYQPSPPGRQVIYTCDFGDNRDHHQTIRGGGRPTRRATSCASTGRGNPVAEDVGGRTGLGGDRCCVPRRAPRRRAAGEAPVVRDAGEQPRDRVNADLGNPSERFERMADAGAAAVARLGRHITASMVPY
ncbi:hypothetical protein DL767_000458 [Monosporascus sp. MG133]|nr:hypothetical protein DL767_000458 [Monosporascus sp. MG133]